VINIFKASYPFQLTCIILAALVLWSKSFLGSPPPLSAIGTETLYCYLITNLQHFPALMSIFAFLLLIFEALFFNLVLHENNLISKGTFLPAFLYILLMSNTVNMLTIHPVLFANFFLILSLQKFFKCYGKEDSLTEFFGISFYISIGSFFYFSMIYIYLFILMGLILYRILGWREWFISFLGLLMPYFFYFIYRFLTNKIPIIPDIYTYYIQNIKLFSLHFKLIDILFYSFLLLLIIIAVPRSILEISDKVVAARKKNYLLIYLIFFSVILIPFSTISFDIHWGMIYLPFSAILGISLFSHKRKKMSSFLLLFLSLSIFYKLFFV